MYQEKKTFYHKNKQKRKVKETFTDKCKHYSRATKVIYCAVKAIPEAIR